MPRKSTTVINVKAKKIAIWSFSSSNILAANLAEVVSHSIPPCYLILANCIPTDAICLCTHTNLIQLLAAVTEC